MTPVYFSGCFGWLHPGKGTVGVVLCAPFGHENMNAHRGWRQLADMLAERGLPVLRFDYPATGNASGAEEDPGQVAAWRGSIHAAAAYLRSVTATEGIVLIGIRLGAALALLSASDLGDLRGLCCLAPVLSGKSYVRELRLLGSAWRAANLLSTESVQDGHLDAVGYRLSAETIGNLSAIELRAVTVPACAVLLMQEDCSSAIEGLTQQLVNQGCDVTRADFPDASRYLQDSITDCVPEAAFRELVGWCAKRFAAPAAVAPAEPSKAVASGAVRERLSDRMLVLPQGDEEAFRFGSRNSLFGILSRPSGERPKAGTVVLMINTGFGRHIGDGRVWVTLARRLAAMGVASLRMDVARFGDSVEGNDQLETKAALDPYAERNAVDLCQAIEALERIGYDQPIIVGICSGAYTGFRAGLMQSRIRGLILVNIQQFVSKPGVSLLVSNRRSRRPTNFYLRAMMQRTAWMRLARGDVDTGALLMALVRQPLEAALREASMLVERTFGRQTQSGEVIRLFRMLDLRQVRVDLLYSDGDPGLSELSQVAGRRGRYLRRLSGVRIGLLPAADHALLDHAARLRFIDRACELIEGHCVTETSNPRESGTDVV